MLGQDSCSQREAAANYLVQVFKLGSQTKEE